MEESSCWGTTRACNRKNQRSTTPRFSTPIKRTSPHLNNCRVKFINRCTAAGFTLLAADVTQNVNIPTHRCVLQSKSFSGFLPPIKRLSPRNSNFRLQKIDGLDTEKKGEKTKLIKQTAIEKNFGREVKQKKKCST